MRVSEIVEKVSKKPIPSWTKYLHLEVLLEDQNGEDVEVRFISVLTSQKLMMPYCVGPANFGTFIDGIGW